MVTGKSAIVIGGTGRIGRAVVSSLLNTGCKVAVVAYRDHSTDEFADSEHARELLLLCQADITIEQQTKECLERIKQAFGRIDYLVYSAGITSEPDVPLADLTTDEWSRTFDVYAKGFFLCFREGLKLIERGGHIVAISSAITRFPADMLPKIYAGQYAAAKAALDELVRWARREAHERKILLSRLAPGAVDTPFHQNAPASRKPPAVLPLRLIAEKIIHAISSSQEIDLQIVAEPNQVLASSTSSLTFGGSI
jgi:NAD(P)-dependent dehydrogenase (short-subunit alcohol dehydrogenase family)